MISLNIDDCMAIATSDVLDDSDFRVWCECGGELDYCDDHTLSECSICNPDTATRVPIKRLSPKSVGV